MTPNRKPGDWLGEVVEIKRLQPGGITHIAKYRVLYVARSVTRHWTPEGVVQVVVTGVPEFKQKRNRRKG